MYIQAAFNHNTLPPLDTTTICKKNSAIKQSALPDQTRARAAARTPRHRRLLQAPPSCPGSSAQPVTGAETMGRSACAADPAVPVADGCEGSVTRRPSSHPLALVKYSAAASARAPAPTGLATTCRALPFFFFCKSSTFSINADSVLLTSIMVLEVAAEARALRPLFILCNVRKYGNPLRHESGMCPEYLKPAIKTRHTSSPSYS